MPSIAFSHQVLSSYPLLLCGLLCFWLQDPLPPISHAKFCLSLWPQPTVIQSLTWLPLPFFTSLQPCPPLEANHSLPIPLSSLLPSSHISDLLWDKAGPKAGVPDLNREEVSTWPTLTAHILKIQHFSASSPHYWVLLQGHWWAWDLVQ